MSENDTLQARISAIEERINGLFAHLKKAYDFSTSHPQISLNQCRMILERILYELYIQEMHKELNRPMIGTMLSDKEFEKKIPRRILAKVKYITDLGNLGSHFSATGEEIESQDAIIVMQELLNVLEWFLAHYHFSDTSNQIETRQVLEILPQLMDKYPKYIKPDITSVKFVQSQHKFLLEITTRELSLFQPRSSTAPPNFNYKTEFEDLGFMIDDYDNNAEPIFTFSPDRSIFLNVEKFLSDDNTDTIFDFLSLFTDKATKKYIPKRETWKEYFSKL